MRTWVVHLATVLVGSLLLGAVASATQGVPTLREVTIPELHACGLTLPQFCQALESAAHAASADAADLRLRCVVSACSMPRRDVRACEELDLHILNMPINATLDLVGRVCGFFWAQLGTEVVVSDAPLDLGPRDTATVEMPEYLRADLKHYAAGREFSSDRLTGFLLERCGVALPPGSSVSVSRFRRRLTVTGAAAAVRDVEYAMAQLTPAEDVVALGLYALCLTDAAMIEALCQPTDATDSRDVDALIGRLTQGGQGRLLGSQRLLLRPGRSEAVTVGLDAPGRARVRASTGSETSEFGYCFRLDLDWRWQDAQDDERCRLHTAVDLYNDMCIVLPLPRSGGVACADTVVPTHLLMQGSFIRDRHQDPVRSPGPYPPAPPRGDGLGRPDTGLRERLRTVLPRVELADAPVPQAVQTLLSLAATVAPDSRPLPAAILLICGEPPPPPADGRGAPGSGTGVTGSRPVSVGPTGSITMRLDYVPIADSLDYAARLTGLQYRVLQDALVVHDPRLGLSALETRYQGAPREEAERTWRDAEERTHGGPVLAHRRQARSPPLIHECGRWLGDLGVTFPPGSVALYHSPPQRYVWRNTAENQRRIQALMASLVDGPYQIRTIVALVQVPDAATWTSPQSPEARRTAEQALAVALWKGRMPGVLFRHDVVASGALPGQTPVTAQSVVRTHSGTSDLRLRPRFHPDLYTMDIGLEWECRGIRGSLGQGLPRYLRTTLRGWDQEPHCLRVGTWPSPTGEAVPVVLAILPVMTEPYALAVCPSRFTGPGVCGSIEPGEPAEQEPVSIDSRGKVQAIIAGPDRVLPRVVLHGLHPHEVWPALRKAGAQVTLTGIPASADAATDPVPDAASNPWLSPVNAGDDDDDDDGDDKSVRGVDGHPQETRGVTVCQPPAPGTWPPRVTLDVAETTVRDIVRMACEQTGMARREEGGRLIIDADSWRSETRSYNVNTADFGGAVPHGVPDRPEPDRESAKACLASLLRDFLPLSPPYRASLFLRQGKLILTARPVDIERCAELIDAVRGDLLSDCHVRFGIEGAAGQGATAVWPEATAGLGEEARVAFTASVGGRPIPLDLTVCGTRSDYHGLLEVRCTVERHGGWRLGGRATCAFCAEPGVPTRIPTGLRSGGRAVELTITPTVHGGDGRLVSLDPKPDAFPVGPDGTRLRMLRVPQEVLGDLVTPGAIPGPAQVREFFVEQGVAADPADRVLYLAPREYLLVRGSPAFEAAIVACLDRRRPAPAVGAKMP